MLPAFLTLSYIQILEILAYILSQSEYFDWTKLHLLILYIELLWNNNPEVLENQK